VEKDLAEGRRLLDEACKGLDVDACDRLEALAGKADARVWCGEDDPSCVPATGPRSIAGLSDACDEGDAKACVQLAGILLDEGPDRDLGRAAVVLRTACDRGFVRACTILGWQYESGMGVPQRDLAEAARWYTRACDLRELRGCGGLAWAYLDGRGVKKDRARAHELGMRACDGGAPHGCAAAAYSLPVKDPSRAAALLERGCNGGDPSSCAFFADVLARGAGVAQDRRRALRLAQSSCERDLNGCYVAGSILSESEDEAERDRGRKALEDACRQGHDAACAKLRRP
jgi:TPR repeat protein